MPLPTAVRERARAFLRPGETIRYIFPASSPSSAFISAHYIFVVTDASVTLLFTGFGSRTNPKEVTCRYPSGTRLGPVDTSQIPFFVLGTTVFEVDEEYVPVINAADAESSADCLPPDPLPDL
ncbi:hypothetical protein [Goodfellowiella coeruleoviolacea]|uniref:Uncharacterized protein n=1 Tax=Goodfellowiella coeruleoviolacea TaxID=334858 RepID=A0AAE3GJE7_9PSEU|nr:hypothetical protein [Goodfellowiella coeruleoviolacea]MCP2169336.1 hypothetical protein [Goodfellowiella coeruleoviolacea]